MIRALYIGVRIVRTTKEERMKKLSRILMLGVLALTPLAFPAAASADDFYAGKTITMIVGYNPGGGVDTASRLLATHLSRFIPGEPEIKIQNMPGGSGVVSANFLAARAEGDGLTIGVPGRTWMLRPVFGEPGTAFDPKTLKYLGSTGTINTILYILQKEGINTADDLQKSNKTIMFGGLGPTTSPNFVTRMLQRSGYPVDVVPGYKGMGAIVLAMEQGEVSGTATGEGTFARRRDLIDSGAIIRLAQVLPEVDGLPLLGDMLNEDERTLLPVMDIGGSIGMPIVAPPDIDADRLETLRKAFLDMTADAEFQKAAEAISEPTGSPLSGEEIQKRMAELVDSVTPELLAVYEQLVAE